MTQVNVSSRVLDRAEMGDTKVGEAKKMPAADVEKIGFDALMAGHDPVVAGFKTKPQALLINILPDPELAEMHRDMAQPNAKQAAAE